MALMMFPYPAGQRPRPRRAPLEPAWVACEEQWDRSLQPVIGLVWGAWFDPRTGVVYTTFFAESPLTYKEIDGLGLGPRRVPA
jgi:hypothetical protein